MALTKLTSNLNTIQNLPNTPALSAEELKEKFDESAGIIKDYINNTLTTETDTTIAKTKTDSNKYTDTKVNNTKTNLEAMINSLEKRLKQDILDKIKNDNMKKYHVGKIIMSTTNTNPSSYLGFGTWTLWGSGRVPVGINTSDSSFNTSEKTGGEKTHKLTIGELPKYNLKYNGVEWVGGNNGSISHIGEKPWKGEMPIPSQGQDQSHNNLQPYIVCYMWKRTK